MRANQRVGATFVRWRQLLAANWMLASVFGVAAHGHKQPFADTFEFMGHAYQMA